MSRAAHAPLRPQAVHQLFLQHSTGLDEQTAINRLVGHAQALVIGILGLQPSGNLFGRPVQDQFTRNDVPQPAVDSKPALLRSHGPVPGLIIRFMGAIDSTATVARNLPTHRRGRSIQMSSYFTNRPARSNPSRYVLSLSQS